MNTRTLAYALLAVLAISTIAAAQSENSTPTPTTTPEPATAPRPEPAAGAVTFAVHAEPASAVVKPGASVAFHVVTRDARGEGAAPLEFAIASRHSGDGWRAVMDGAPPTLVVSAGENASAYAAYQIVARDPTTNESHDAIVKVALARADPVVPTQSFVLQLAPEAQRAKPGDEVAFHVIAKARNATTLKLGIGARLPDGFAAAVDHDALTLVAVPCPATAADAAPTTSAAANAEAACSHYEATTTLRVKVPEHPRADGVVLEVFATNEAGERHAAHAKLAIGDPSIAPKPVANNDTAALLARLHELEARVRELEQREKALRDQLRVKEDFIARLAAERGSRASANGTLDPMDLTDARLTLAPNALGGWRAIVADEHGRVLGGNARLFLLMEVAGGAGPADG